MNMYKKLLDNSIIFAIGNLGSKLLTILLVPLYTYYLTTTEYGIVDIITTTSIMITPIITLSIYDALFRFVMEKNQDRDAIFTNALMVTTIGTFALSLLYIICDNFFDVNELVIFALILIIFQAYQKSFAEFVRAIGKLKIYALDGILITLIICLLNILFLVYFNLGIRGYLLSFIIGSIFSIIYLTSSAKIYNYFAFTKLNIELTKKMLIYSIPLIPNAFMWWIINLSSRYFILFFVGVSANGLFAIASKIPALLMILNSVFFQAWQLSAIEEFKSRNKSEFYSKVFGYFSLIMLLGTTIILLTLKPIMIFFISPDFYKSWEFVPFLLMGVVFSSFSGFLGTNYIAAKQTKGVFKTSMIGGGINIILNIILIPIIGVNGAGISTMISFFIIWVMRVYDTKKYINMELNIKTLTLSLLLIFIHIFIMYMKLSVLIEIFLGFIIFLSIILINIKLIIPIWTSIIIYLKKIKKVY